jgi:hypothetical protein
MNLMNFSMIEIEELNSINGGGFLEGAASVLIGVGAAATAVAVCIVCPPVAVAAAALVLFPAGVACVGFGIADMLGNDNIKF